MIGRWKQEERMDLPGDIEDSYDKGGLTEIGAQVAATIHSMEDTCEMIDRASARLRDMIDHLDETPEMADLDYAIRMAKLARTSAELMYKVCDIDKC